MWRAFAFAALTFALIAPASAQDGPRLLNTLDELTRRDAFPPVALARGVSGNVMLSCAVAADATAQCNVAEETPTGMGFGAAAQSLAHRLQFAPVAGTVLVPVLFENQNTQAAIIESPLVVEGGAHINLAGANEAYAQLMATLHALSACEWSGRPNCARLDPTAPRAFTNITHYPATARAAGIEGRALVACAFRVGRRVDCALEGAEHGFGDAALNLVTSVATAQIDQFEAGQAVRVPVEFAMVGPDGSRGSAWSERPSASDFNRFTPRNDALLRQGVRVMMACAILPTGALDCTVLGEPPRAFGDAALRIAESFRLDPAAIGRPGYAAGDRVKIPISFRSR